MDRFRAYRINDEGGKIVARFQDLSLDDLTDGNVVVRVSHLVILFSVLFIVLTLLFASISYPLNCDSTNLRAHREGKKSG